MNVLDSSGWLAYFADEKNADIFAPIAEDTHNLIVPVICLYEIFKVVTREKSETEALVAVSIMKKAEIIDLDSEICLNAASINKEYSIPMADSMIYATAQKYNATLWTQDSDFKNMPSVRYFEKNK